MSYRRSILIQSIGEYLGLIKPYVINVVRSLHLPIHQKNIENNAIEWIIAEELELIYGIFVRGHEHNSHIYSIIHNLTDRSMPISLSRVTARYIKAPQIYCEYEVNLKLNSRDLILEYQSKTQPW